MTFEEFDKAVFEIAQQIQAEGFCPDVIVAIARGGWIPSRLLSKYLGVKRLSSFGVTYADDARTQLVTYDEPFPALEDSKILLVEDYLESGRTMKFCQEHLHTKQNLIKTCAVGYRQDSVIVPDYTSGLIAFAPRFSWD